MVDKTFKNEVLYAGTQAIQITITFATGDWVSKAFPIDTNIDFPNLRYRLYSNQVIITYRSPLGENWDDRKKYLLDFITSVSQTGIRFKFLLRFLSRRLKELPETTPFFVYRYLNKEICISHYVPVKYFDDMMSKELLAWCDEKWAEVWKNKQENIECQTK